MCGIFGIWGNKGIDVNEVVYSGMYGVQHRGQQSSGMAFVMMKTIAWHRDIGLMTEIFDEARVAQFAGAKAGIGHAGYSDSQLNLREAAQPLVYSYYNGKIALAFNGRLINSHELLDELQLQGYVFNSASDAEIIAVLLIKAYASTKTLEHAIARTMKKLIGAYSMLILTPDNMVAVRDPRGMKPLSLGSLDGNYVIASETAAFNTIGAEFIRDITPGEIATISDGGISSRETHEHEKTAMCIFEHIYMARNDSVIDGVSVYESRLEAGRRLAMSDDVKADVVIGAPDSGIAAAVGYAQQSGIRFTEGFNKNRYIGRTFIQPSQKMRENAVALKLSVIRSQIEGKRVILIDDSIVRGTTSSKIVQLLKTNGKASEVHVRISSPLIKHPCHYGIDTRDKDVLVGSRYDIEGIRSMIGADSLRFLRFEDLDYVTNGAKCGFCKACFNGDYPI